MNKNSGNTSIIHRTLIFVNSLKKRMSKKSFYFHFLRWMGFVMIPLTALYHKYIDRPKFSEQKKPFDNIVPPSPLKWESEQLVVMQLQLRN